MIEGVNKMLDAVIGPLNSAVKHAKWVSIGNRPKLIWEDYKGDFNVLKKNLNGLVNTLAMIIEKTKLKVSGDLTDPAQNSRQTYFSLRY